MSTKPIQFFRHQHTVWYNLADYIQLLLNTQIIHPIQPTLLFKRKRPAKSIQAVLFDKVNRLNPDYQLQQDGRTYVDWVVFEHLYRLVRPYLVYPDDWMNPESMFRQLQLVINRPIRSQLIAPWETLANYFTELTDMPAIKASMGER